MKLTLAEMVHLMSLTNQLMEVFCRHYQDAMKDRDSLASKCYSEMETVYRKSEMFLTTATVEREPRKPGTRLCDVCGGHGANPGSDNTNWLPCVDCHGTGKVP